MSVLRPTRRELLALGAAGVLVPRRLFAGPVPPSERRFLFVFAAGGWDVSYALASMHDNPLVDIDPASVPAEVNGIPFVDADTRPSVRAFFETWGGRTCVLHGLEVRSVAHTNCLRLMMTGTSSPSADDWGAIIGAAGGDYGIPHLLVSGPSFAWAHGSAVGRIGAQGQLAGLLDGTALLDSDQAVAPSADAVRARVDAYLRDRLARAPGSPGEARLASAYGGALDRLDRVRAADALDFAPGEGFAAKAALAVAALEQGTSRSAIVQHDGFRGLGWDSHGNNRIQDSNWETLLAEVDVVLADLAARRGPAGGSLLDQTTVVLLSEMARHPVENTFGGKDHWTWTSAVLVGAGVRGGQVIGGYDDAVAGLPIDLTSGESVPTGTQLDAAHLGATLLALAGVDPEPYVPGFEPVLAVLE